MQFVIKSKEDESADEIGTLLFDTPAPSKLPCDGQLVEIDKEEPLFQAVGHKYSPAHSAVKMVDGMPQVITSVIAPPVGFFYLPNIREI